MAAIITSVPTSPVLNGNDIWVEVETDLVNEAAAATFTMVPTGSGPTIGQELILEWGGASVTFTVAATSNSTATAIPVKDGGDSIEDYCLILAEILRQNGLLSNDFDITVTATSVILTARNPGLLDLTVTSDLTNFTVTEVDGTDPYTEPNLAAMLEIWRTGDTVSEDERITTLHGTYDVNTSKVAFNLTEIFPVKAQLPPTSHIAPTLFTSWLRGIAANVFVAYHLRAADKYGTPAIPEALLRTEGSFYCHHGAHSADRIPSGALSIYANVLHNYRRSDGETFWKPLGDGQPDFLYIWTKQEMAGCNVEWDVIWDDGTTTTEVYTGTAFTLLANKVYHVRASPLNFNITPPTAGLIPWYITFRLKFGEISLATVKYKAVITTQWERFLLFDNGVGGVESVLFHGKGVNVAAATREEARRNRSRTFTAQEGELITFNPEGRGEFTLNTGWIDSFYAAHLRQLLLGRAWLVDVPRKRFLALSCDTSSVQTFKDDEGLVSLAVKFKAAWIDKAFNV